MPIKSKNDIINLLKDKELIEIEGEDGIHGIILSLCSKNIISYNQKTEDRYFLTEEGLEILEKGSPEYRYFYSDLKLDKSIGLSYAIRNKWVKVENGCVFRIVDSVEDVLKERLRKFESDQNIKELIKRKLVEKRRAVIYIISRGENFMKEDENLISEITADMIGQKLSLKSYNWNTEGILPNNGALHPLSKIKNEFREIFLEMGFKEMNTQQYVESSFWNFDVLFQPQNHPSRESHDTFFIKNPKYSEIPEEYSQRVKMVHEQGAYGSIGYRYVWDPREAMKNILRTHTTAVSARYLYNLKTRHAKFFSIDRVFRNEHIDATHLAEFHQIEGLIVGENLTLKHLLGILTAFYTKLGIKKLKFKPAYNPYTEPSVEIFAFHPSLNKYIEIGNSGIFRPEMTMPMGLEQTVIAWGLSLERPAMIKYGIKNIRDLFGHTVDLESIRKSQICYF